MLNLQITPNQVDVNVHPAKLEVRFKNDDEIYELFYEAVFKALEQVVLIPQVGWDKVSAVKTTDKPIKVEQQKIEDIPVYKSVPSSFSPERGISGATGKTVDQLLNRQQGAQNQVRQNADEFLIDPVIVRGKEETTAEKEASLMNEISHSQNVMNQGQEGAMEPEVEPFFKQYKIIGQIFQTYWMIEQGDCLYLIDQHAAHERILFEELMARFQEENMVSQKLLLPQMLNLSPSEIEVLKENQSLLEGFGFEFETFGQNQYALRAVPYLLKEPSGAGFFTEILDSLSEQKIRSVYDMKLLAVATKACKAAVKGHDRLSFQEAEAMIGRLLKLENPFTCPHGRPTIIEMTKYELEKKFKRIQN